LPKCSKGHLGSFIALRRVILLCSDIFLTTSDIGLGSLKRIKYHTKRMAAPERYSLFF